MLLDPQLLHISKQNGPLLLLQNVPNQARDSLSDAHNKRNPTLLCTKCSIESNVEILHVLIPDLRNRFDFYVVSHSVHMFDLCCFLF